MTARKHNGNPAPQGFTPDPNRTQSPPDAPSAEQPGASADDAREVAGQNMALAATSQAQAMALQIKEVNAFADRVGRALAEQAAPIFTGQTLGMAFTDQLNQIVAQAGSYSIAAAPDVDSFIESLSLDGPLPEVKPRFYLAPQRRPAPLPPAA